MPQSASVPYNPVPSVESTGSLGGGFGVRSTPEAAGAQVSAAVEQAGDKGFEFAQKQQGMINETQMVNGETALSQKLGALHGEYMSLSGLEAHDRLPEFQAKAQAAIQEVRGTIRGKDAIHGYDMLAERRLGNVTQDWEGYAAGQVKQANESAQLGGLHAATLRASDTNVAADDQRFAEEVTGPIKYHASAMLDETKPGFKTDSETGKVSFDDTPIGQNAKANFENNLNHYLGQAYTQRYDTLSDTIGPVAANEKFQQDKAKIPLAAQPQIEASLESKVFNSHISSIVNTTMGEAKQAHEALLVNPSSVGSNAYNLGNVKTAEGAVNNTQDFVNPATPVDGVILTANNLRSKNYEGKTLAQIGNTWTSTDKAVWVKNVSAVSGISPDTVPNLNDPATMSKLLKGISVAEGKNKGIFSDNIISQGVTASLNGQKPTTVPPKSYATNELGGKLSDADYYASHRDEVIQGARAWAEKTSPGNLRLSNAAIERVTQEMNAAISSQNGQLAQYKNIIQRASNGEFTQGKLPTSEEMYAIPQVADAINKVSIHDSTDFMRRLDERLALRSDGKDKKTFGDEYIDALKGIHPTDGSVPAITNSNQLYDMQYAGKITDAGREKLEKVLQEKNTPEGSVDGKMYSAVLDAGKSILLEDKEAWPSGLVAMTKLDDELKAKGIPSSERYAGMDNKNSILHALDPMIAAKNSPDAIAEALAKVESDKPSIFAYATTHRAVVTRNLISDFQNGKYTNDKDAGELALKAAILNGTLDEQTAKDMAVAYGYAKKAP